ncbi:CDP-alcohol phosphatidyltransferase-domain-containing protein [Aspergillus aurantiobrunneus]
MSARTRRQKAALAAQSEGSDGSPMSNGTTEKLPNRNRSATPDDDDDDDDDGVRENVYLFAPNIIGYVRVVLAIASLYYMPLHPRTCSILYSVSCLLDALDGYAARYFNQSTTFGAVLDMVTDRCTTACLLVFLSSAWPRWALVFQSLIALDMASHYMHMYATLSMGGANQSHKKIDSSRSWVLYLYYNSRTVLFICCALNELFFIGLYLLSFSSPTLSPSLLLPPQGVTVGGTPPPPSSTSVFASPWSAGALELARANKIDSFWPWVITSASSPVMLFKQFVNVVQLIKAANWLVEGDLVSRRRARSARKN